MKFYTSVDLYKNKILYSGYSNGARVRKTVNYAPSLFVPTPKESKYKSVRGLSLDEVKFDSIYDAKQFIQNYKDVEGFSIYGMEKFVYAFIADYYSDNILFDSSLIKVWYLDIEVASDEGFPDISTAVKPITAISIRCGNKVYSFGCGDYVTANADEIYIKCADEEVLLKNFLAFMEKDYPDVLTGWNIEFFDIPYLINRINRVLGDGSARRLSPWGYLNTRKIFTRGKETTVYNPVGIAILDYIALYKKFTEKTQESYSLNNISFVELNENKIDYSEFESLLDLYKNDHQKFIEYNIHDVNLVWKLEQKLKLLELVFVIAFDSKINFEDTLSATRTWDALIYNHLLKKNIIINPSKRPGSHPAIVGAYVKEPNPKAYGWVLSFDLASLYPHLIMQYNIGPDTFVKYKQTYTIDELLRGSKVTGDFAYTPNGCFYRKDIQGFLAELMEIQFKNRSVYKKEMFKYENLFEETKDSQYENEAKKFHNFQWSQKIKLNSLYGCLTNEFFRWFDVIHGEAVTTAGQLSIRWIEQKLNEILNKLGSTENIDYVIASDTDSVYLDMDSIVAKYCAGKSKKEIVNFLDKLSELKLQPFINEQYDVLAKNTNSYKNTMKMKREAIADKGIWRAKKNYILNVWSSEEIFYDTPKIKTKGVETERSSTPKICRDALKECFEIIANGTEKDLINYVETFKQKYMAASFTDIAAPSSVKGLTKYSSNGSDLYITGAPVHVKASLLYNHLLKEKNLQNKYDKIYESDKIKWAYLKTPNPTKETVIASPNIIPVQFGIDKYIDYDAMFEKNFLKPLASIISLLGWNYEQVNTIEDFFG